MPFKLGIQRIEYGHGELSITGKIVEGAYFGPEAVEFTAVSGQRHRAVVVQHGMQFPEGWPVLPAHRTLLTLTIRTPSSDVKVDTTQPLLGRGQLQENQKRVDITPALNEPLFWATFLGYQLSGDEFDETAEPFWGLSQEAVNAFYNSEINGLQERGAWPYVRLPLQSAPGKYVEIEFAAAAEYQIRFWIGDDSAGKRCILGYDSGHFSLPAFRIAEIVACGKLLKSHSVMQTAALLLLRGCYVSGETEWPAEFITQLAEQVPGIKPRMAVTASRVLLASSMVPESIWTERRDLGWVNSGSYSQRNPEGRMSVLMPDDYAFIRAFFP